MKNENNKQNMEDYGKTIFAWNVPEFEKHERSKKWYIVASILAIILLFFAFFTNNFTFAVIIILASLIMILHDGQEPMSAGFKIAEEGIVIGKNFYDYDEIKNFSIVYKPNVGVKNIYFEFKSSFRPRLSVPLNNENPLPIRENLLKYLTEDLERTDRPLSEELANFFKL
ncbi:MAG: hypothetical protein ABH881_00455 [bacterium]